MNLIENHVINIKDLIREICLVNSLKLNIFVKFLF